MNAKLFASIWSIHFFYTVSDKTYIFRFIFKANAALMGIKKKSSAKREYYDENVFLKADRALNKLNFLFHLKSKINLVICM